jgi:hypothetical protein
MINGATSFTGASIGIGRQTVLQKGVIFVPTHGVGLIKQ